MNGTSRYRRGSTVVLAIVLALQPLAAAGDQDRQAFDYSSYAAVLKTYVNDAGMVNYRGLKARPEKLLSYLRAIGRLPRERYDAWNEAAKIAFWVNAYNSLTLKAVVDNYPIRASFFRSLLYPKNSIRQISGVWDRLKFDVMDKKLTLEHIEHKILRVEFDEPRIHMALVCAALGCPPLRNEPYVGSRLDEQLDDQARTFLSNPEKFRIDRSREIVYLSPIFKWFGQDFVGEYAPAEKLGRLGRETSAVLAFVAGYLDGVDKRYVLDGDYRIGYLDYDWSLNEQKR